MHSARQQGRAALRSEWLPRRLRQRDAQVHQRRSLAPMQPSAKRGVSVSADSAYNMTRKGCPSFRFRSSRFPDWYGRATAPFKTRSPSVAHRPHRPIATNRDPLTFGEQCTHERCTHERCATTDHAPTCDENHDGSACGSGLLRRGGRRAAPRRR